MCQVHDSCQEYENKTWNCSQELYSLVGEPNMLITRISDSKYNATGMPCVVN